MSGPANGVSSKNANAPILLTGATGFVGGALWPALEAAGYTVRGLTRDVEKAQTKWPQREWARGDVESGEGLHDALTGCSAAFYLVHGMGRGDYRARDKDAAERFTIAAAASGIGRIIYLGGVEPQGEASEHLASRLEVGQILRQGAVPALELRASMIVGRGSLSWWIVRDLAARLPGMILPRWLRSHTQPVAIDDVVIALARGLEIPLPSSASYDLPGPDSLPARDILFRTAAMLGLRKPLTVEVPALPPWLASHWVHFVTRAEWNVAREVILGLSHDLLARNADYWPLIGHTCLLDYNEAARRALSAEGENGDLTGFPALVETAVQKLHAAKGRKAAQTPGL